jgi:ABC-type ATPase with predicted acetyltransferase domain
MTNFGDVAVAMAQDFDFDLRRSNEPFVPFDLESLTSEPFRVGLVVGPSGSGKTQALNTAAKFVDRSLLWNPEKCVADRFENKEIAEKCLAGAGLNSVPQWFKPYRILSNGERYRADLAMALMETLTSDKIVAVDEFTSVVDRVVARSLCESLNRFLTKNSRLLLATCHYDVVEWIQPDWVADVTDHSVTRNRSQRYQRWEMFVGEQVAELRRG